MDVLHALTDEPTAVVHRAHEEARSLGHNWVGPEHLLVGLTQDPGPAGQLLRNTGVTAPELRERFRWSLDGERPPADHIYFTPRAKLVVEFAVDESRKAGADGHVSPGHLLVAITRDSGSAAAKALAEFGLTLEILRSQFAPIGTSQTKV